MKGSATRCFLISAASLAAAACGGPSEGVDASDVATGSVDVATPVDATDAADAAPIGPADADAGPAADVATDVPTGSRGFGRVQLTQQPRLSRTTASAVFRAPGDTTCATALVDGCQVDTCAASSAAMRPNAGAITFSGGMIAAGMPMTIAPQADGTYTVATGARVWTGGEMLRFQAAGAAGGVGVFDRMIAAPTSIAITAPSFSTSMRIPRSTGFEVRWTGGGTGSVLFTFQNLPGSGPPMPTAVVTCAFPAAGGMATVPSTALMRLAAGAGVVSAQAATISMMAVGDYDVTVAATEPGSATGASMASVSTTFE
jgi:hypothetical protein